MGGGATGDIVPRKVLGIPICTVEARAVGSGGGERCRAACLPRPIGRDKLCGQCCSAPDAPTGVIDGIKDGAFVVGITPVGVIAIDASNISC
jgi:hypothetical protein